MTHELKTYSRLTPNVLAIQLTPGVEDGWIATDANGQELSRASTIASVQAAAPHAADYTPMLDLPGLQGQVLHMGDYVINDGDGVFFTMPKDTFEELFGEGEGKELKVVGGKHADKTWAYGAEQLTGGELLAHLVERDNEVLELSAYRDELLKIAEQTGEGADPFAAWETIALWQQAYSSSQNQSLNTDGSNTAGNSSTASDASTDGDKENPTSAAPSTSEPATTQPQSSETGAANSGQQTSSQPNTSNSSEPSELTSDQKASGPSTSATGQPATEAKSTDPLDHDADGKKGGSKPKAKKAASKTDTAT